MSERATKMLRQALLDPGPTGMIALRKLAENFDPHKLELIVPGADQRRVDGGVDYADFFAERYHVTKQELAIEALHRERAERLLRGHAPSRDVETEIMKVIAQWTYEERSMMAKAYFKPLDQPTLVRLLEPIPASTVRRHLIRLVDEGKIVRQWDYGNYVIKLPKGDQS